MLMLRIGCLYEFAAWCFAVDDSTVSTMFAACNVAMVAMFAACNVAMVAMFAACTVAMVAFLQKESPPLTLERATLLAPAHI